MSDTQKCEMIARLLRDEDIASGFVRDLFIIKFMRANGMMPHVDVINYIDKLSKIV